MSIYIDKQKFRPGLSWDSNKLLPLLSEVRYRQGHLSGRMEGIPVRLRMEALMEALTLEVVRSAELDGEPLSAMQVRCSLAGHLGCEIDRQAPAGVDAVKAAGLMMEVVRHFEQPLTEKRLMDWHRGTSPVRHRRLHPMVHYQGPRAYAAPAELRAFLHWFNTVREIDPVIKAGVAWWWFMTLCPLDGGNSRIAQVIADMQLARADGCGYRYYSLSDSMSRDRGTFDRFVLEARKTGAQHVIQNAAQTAAEGGTPDITSFLEWFLRRLGHALSGTDGQLSAVLRKARFWEKHASIVFNERQRLILGLLLDGLEDKLSSSYWARLTATSSDTAVRDINDLVQKGVLMKEAAGGRSTSYVLAES